ncbi:MAG: family 10 glycosylhydrolase [Candidatus Promineifilaceae bacterium]|nr:family 10 glycosylhydrolase [Candidatus Promineifilaceae bacterium]
MRLIKNRLPPFFLLCISIIGMDSWLAAAQESNTLYLPHVSGHNIEKTEEVRGIWVTRFDWTNFASADPIQLDQAVDDIVGAGFNVIFFQVRGVADAYYTPGLEPWARRLTGTLGKDPGYDPLERLIEQAHARGVQVHAYLNAYPVWTGCEAPPDDTTPRHLYYLLLEEHGETDGKLNGLQWNSDDQVLCGVYQRIAPASIFADTHLLAVVEDLVLRYEIDGIHLDHIRYDGPDSSCDPISENRYGEECFSTGAYKDWQRQQVDGTVRKIYERVTSLKPDIWLTTAVWPIYRDQWNWGVNTGYESYYQDSRAWMANHHIDGITPMIYSGSPDCSKPYFWTQDRWHTLVMDYQDHRFGRFIIPGIGTTYCEENDFKEIEARIQIARSLGTAGHAIFSYKSLAEKGFFDDLAAGPYQSPAIVPEITWR